MIDLTVWWNSLQPSVQAAIIAAGATIFAAATGALIGALVVARQIKKQAANAIRQNQHNEALKLKMKVYEEIIGACAQCWRAEARTMSFVLSLYSILDIGRAQQAAARSIFIPTQRFQQYLDLQTSVNDAAIGMIALTERWQTIDPRIEVFRTAFNVAMHDFREASWRYANTIASLLPFDRQDAPGQIYPWSPPNDQQVSTMENFGTAVIKGVNVLGSFAQDFQLEMQNLLVGELFGHKVPSRIPVDPKYPVITLDNHALLEAHFAKDTAWGKNKKIVEDDVRSRLAEANAGNGG